MRSTLHNGVQPYISGVDFIELAAPGGGGPDVGATGMFSMRPRLFPARPGRGREQLGPEEGEFMDTKNQAAGPPMQERAKRTRENLLLAAGAVFDEYGYAEGTLGRIYEKSGITKGGVYFHFQSKEALAQAVVNAQVGTNGVPDQECKVQQLLDVTFAFTERLLTDPLAKGSTRLSTDQDAPGFDHAAPYRDWADLLVGLLDQAKDKQELLPTADVRRIAEMLVGAFAGIQVQARALNGREDLRERVSFLLKSVLASFVVPGMIPSIDAEPDRGLRMWTETHND
jgi:AcrR family transcriptional regulator